MLKDLTWQPAILLKDLFLQNEFLSGLLKVVQSTNDVVLILIPQKKTPFKALLKSNGNDMEENFENKHEKTKPKLEVSDWLGRSILRNCLPEEILQYWVARCTQKL